MLKGQITEATWHKEITCIIEQVQCSHCLNLQKGNQEKCYRSDQVFTIWNQKEISKVIEALYKIS